MAICKSCEREIIWAQSQASGKPIPLDAKPVKDGNMVLLAGGITRRYTEEDGRLHRERHVSHFATCPDAGDWRRK